MKFLSYIKTIFNSKFISHYDMIYLYNNRDKNLNIGLDKNFDLACELSEKNFSHKELLIMLKNGNVAERQIAALKFDNVENNIDACALMNNLTGCDGKIREAVALRINQIIISNPKSREFFNIPLVFADATIDINANICRLIVDSTKYLKNNTNFTQIYIKKILEFTQQAFDELDKFIFKDKKYVINKQLFKLYWCLETLQNFYMDIEYSTLKSILYKGAEQSEYTIREKVAQIVKLTGCFKELETNLKNDENYYVRTVLN